MDIKVISKYIGNILRFEGVFMIPALLIALYKNERPSVIAFAFVLSFLVIFGSLLTLIKPEKEALYNKEGFAIVSLSWILLSAFGALPFFISGAIPNYVDCFFETVSGFTTTGSSILTNIEAMPKSLLYWRSFTHWLGGMGVLVFVLAILPTVNGSGHSLRVLRAESPGPSVGKLAPKIKYTARILYSIYITLTLLEILFLFVGGMSLFESVTLTFGTAGTGGFGVKNDSIAGYSSYSQIVIAIFMILFGVNFNIYYLALAKNIKKILKDQELKLYLGIILAAVTMVTINTLQYFSGPLEAIKHSFFQVASIMTTTGYVTTDFNAWPQFSKYILVFLMFVGACAGSTGGGIKIQRILILFKSLKNSLKKMVHPRSVRVVQMDGKKVDEDIIQNAYSFIAAYIFILVTSMLLISLQNFSFETIATSVAACLNNVGPGLGLVGPKGNYSQFSTLSKLVLCIDMLVGRLEIFPILLLFSPALWKRSK